MSHEEVIAVGKLSIRYLRDGTSEETTGPSSSPLDKAKLAEVMARYGLQLPRPPAPA